MQPLKQKTLIIGMIAVAAFLALPGCKDSPDQQARKKLQHDMQNALDTVSTTGKVRITGTDDDLKLEPVDMPAVHQAARQSVIAALRNVKDADSKSIANLANGNLSSDQAIALQLKIDEKTKPILKLVESIAKSNQRITDLNLQKVGFEKIIESNNTQIVELNKIITPDQGDKPGLQAQLKTATDNMALLNKTNNEYLDMVALAQQAIDDINAKAAEKFKAAEIALGDEEIELKKQAYDLQLSTKEFYLKKQNAQDLSDIEQGKIDVLAKLLSKLQKNLTEVQAKIKAIQESDSNAKLQQAVADITTETKTNQDKISELANSLMAAHTAYINYIAQIQDLHKQAKTDYGSAKARSVARLAGLRLAYVNHEAADVALSAAQFNNLLYNRIDLIRQNATPPTADALQQIADAAAKAKTDYSQTALIAYDDAVLEYESNSSGDDTQMSLLLALYGKTLLADLLEDNEMFKAADDKAAEIAAKITDKSFAKTTTAKLLGGEYNFTPQVKVDIELISEAKKNLFKGWEKLKGQDRKAAVEKLLLKYDQMKLTESPELMEQLAPEKDALDAAMAAGFEEETATTDSNSLPRPGPAPAPRPRPR